VPDFQPLSTFREYPVDQMIDRAQGFLAEMARRRTVRHFSDRPVPREVIEACLASAGTAPSGANLQPWHFVVVTNPILKRKIRLAAEAEERDFYHRRATKEWLDALSPLGTDEHKPFLETAPTLIAVFALGHRILPDGRRAKNYYVNESVGIATGILITALHNAGLASLTHTPSPMGFLNQILDRPNEERPYLLLVTGYPAKDAVVPRIAKKTLREIATFAD
jgi:iodotyrosine deiodinase